MVTRKLSQIGMILGIVAISLFSFSRANQFNLQFNKEKIAHRGFEAGFNQTPIVIDAQTLLGSNFTDIFSKTAASFIMSLYPEGPNKILTETPTAKLPMDTISSLASKEVIQRLNQEQKIFSRENLSFVADTQENILTYLSFLEKLRKTYLEPFRSDDLLLLADAANHQANLEARTKLVQYIELSQKAIDELETVAVPDSFAGLHLSFINLLNESNYIALGLLLENNDPLRTLLAARAYPLLGQKYINFTNAFSKTLKEKGLTF
jgi:hypothetical protein